MQCICTCINEVRHGRHVVCVDVGMCDGLVSHGYLSIILLCITSPSICIKELFTMTEWSPPSLVCGRGRAIPCDVCNDSWPKFALHSHAASSRERLPVDRNRFEWEGGRAEKGGRERERERESEQERVGEKGREWGRDCMLVGEGRQAGVLIDKLNWKA